MSDDAPSKRSFSPGRKWSIAFDVVVRTVVVLAVVVMANYLAGRYFGRFYLSSQTRVELSPRTVSVLKSITNEVKVVLYYEKDDPLYSTITGLLGEYRAVNPRISIESVDYSRDASESQRIKAIYKLDGTADKNEKNVVIFDCEGRTKIVPGEVLAQFTLEPLGTQKDGKPEFRRKIVAFNGEVMFTSMLLGVINPKPLHAYFLQNHGEHRIDSADEATGYMKFASVLEQNYVQPQPLSLLGTNDIPQDCNLLVIAGPTTAISQSELDKIQQYLKDGGRLLAMFNYTERAGQSGLQGIIARWGVVVGDDLVQDPKQSEGGSDVVISAFAPRPVVNPLINSAIQLILPHPLQAVKSDNRETDAPKAEEVAFTTEQAFLKSSPQKQGRYAVVATIENAVRGVVTERGTTRILVVGDSFLFGNGMIEKWANHDFAGYAVNWLLDRSLLLEGLGPRPVTEFRINMTRSQMQTVQWILLAAVPGGVLLLGVLVWLGRRK